MKMSSSYCRQKKGSVREPFFCLFFVFFTILISEFSESDPEISDQD